MGARRRGAHVPRATGRVVPIAGAVIVSALVLGGCSSTGGSSGDDHAPIKVGQITTQSGGYPFGDTVPGTQSYINYLNAHGGLDGHQVTLVSGDDKGDATEAAQLARKMIQQDGVIGFVGNTSIVDCQANRAFYENHDVAVIGGGAQNDCFTQPNWTPVNAGPFVGHLVEWQYVMDLIKPKAFCGIEQNDATSQPYFEQLIAEFEAKNNMKFVSVTFTNDASQNPTPAVANAKAAGCDAIYMSTVAPNFAAFVQAAKSVGLDATFIDVGSGYDVTLPSTLGDAGQPGALGSTSEGVFVAAELAPVDADIPQVKEMVAQFKKDNVPANFWSQIGWLSAKVFFEGLKQNASNSDLTTAKGVLDALRAMSPIDTGFAATPLTFGPGDTHAPNLGSRVLQVKDGQFVTAPGQDGGWTVVSAPTPFKG